MDVVGTLPEILSLFGVRFASWFTSEAHDKNTQPRRDGEGKSSVPSVAKGQPVLSSRSPMFCDLEQYPTFTERIAFLPTLIIPQRIGHTPT